MTQIGEPISVAIEMAEQGKCMVCGKDHGDPKREKIEPTGEQHGGWKRSENMSAVCDGAKSALYPNGAQNVPPYTTAGHHCVAFSSFVEQGKDVFARANHFLHKKGFKPNDAKNIIHLPNSKDSLQRFIGAGKPLQPHTGKHPKNYFMASKLVARRAIALAQPESAEQCKDEDPSKYEDRLKKLMEQAVNYACTRIVEYKWLVQRAARYREYIADYRGKGPLPPPWQSISLDVGPFKKG